MGTSQKGLVRVNEQLQNFLQWGADGVIGLMVIWAGYTNRRFTRLEDKHDELNEELSKLKVLIATIQTTVPALERMESKLDELSKLVHMIAGKQGITY